MNGENRINKEWKDKDIYIGMEDKNYTVTLQKYMEQFKNIKLLKVAEIGNGKRYIVGEGCN